MPRPTQTPEQSLITFAIQAPLDKVTTLIDTLTTIVRARKTTTASADTTTTTTTRAPRQPRAARPAITGPVAVPPPVNATTGADSGAVADKPRRGRPRRAAAAPAEAPAPAAPSTAATPELPPQVIDDEPDTEPGN